MVRATIHKKGEKKGSRVARMRTKIQRRMVKMMKRLWAMRASRRKVIIMASSGVGDGKVGRGRGGLSGGMRGRVKIQQMAN